MSKLLIIQLVIALPSANNRISGKKEYHHHHQQTSFPMNKQSLTYSSDTSWESFSGVSSVSDCFCCRFSPLIVQWVHCRQISKNFERTKLFKRKSEKSFHKKTTKTLSLFIFLIFLEPFVSVFLVCLILYLYYTIQITTSSHQHTNTSRLELPPSALRSGDKQNIQGRIDIYWKLPGKLSHVLYCWNIYQRIL